MSLRIERDPAFWTPIAAHPMVAPYVQVSPEQIAALVASPGVMPLASDNGGFLFRNLDGLGFVFELHTLFTPKGWGREVVVAAREAFTRLFGAEVALVVTHEQALWWRSRPPVSHGWRSAGGWKDSAIGPLRLWMLTPQAWADSPASRRRRRTLH